MCRSMNRRPSSHLFPSNYDRHQACRTSRFKLAGESNVNANPKDTHDHPSGVWTLSPTYRLKDVNRAKYAAIVESDRFTLKFVKVH
jgi:predicted methyltransferase